MSTRILYNADHRRVVKYGSWYLERVIDSKESYQLPKLISLSEIKGSVYLTDDDDQQGDVVMVTDKGPHHVTIK